MMALAFWAASVAVFEVLLGALIAAVGEHDEDFAAGLLAELVVGGEIDGVVEQRSAGGAVAGDGAGAGTGVDLGGVDGSFDLARIVGVVGEEVDVNVEGDEEGFVLGGEDVFEELGAGGLFEGKDVLLAAAGVEEDADGEGEIFLLGEVLGFLEGLVLVDAAVVFVEVGDVAALVADGEVDVDEIDVDFEGLDVADVDGLGLGFAGGGRAAGGRCLLRVEDGGETEGEGDCGGEAKIAHTALDDEVGTEFREKNADGRVGTGATLGEGGTSNRNGLHLALQDGDGGWGGCAGSLVAGRAMGPGRCGWKVWGILRGK